MKVVDLKVKGLNIIMQRASNNAVKENIALNLSYQVVEDNNLVQINTDGSRKILRRSKFQTVKLNLAGRSFILGTNHIKE